MWLLFFNGLRASEAAAVDVENLHEHDGHRVLRVCGKGETERNHRVPLNAPTITALERWLPERDRIAGATAGAPRGATTATVTASTATLPFASPSSATREPRRGQVPHAKPANTRRARAKKPVPADRTEHGGPATGTAHSMRRSDW